MTNIESGGQVIIAYLNDSEATYVEFERIICKGDAWLSGIETGSEHRVDIPVRSILYVDEGGYEMEGD